MPYAPTLTDSADLAEVRSHLMGAGEYLLDLRRKPEDKRGEGYADDLRSAIDFINHFDVIEKAMEAGQRAARAKAEDEQRAKGPSTAFDALQEQRVTPGRELVGAEGYEEWAQRGATGMFSADVRTLLLSENTDPGAGVFRPVGTPVLATGAIRQQRLFVRDVLSVQSTGLASVPYIRESNAATNETGAATTSEGSAKAEVTMQFTQQDAPIRKITAWLPATTEILADAPTLRGYIDNRLAYMILLREEQQVLAGDGSAPNLRGITETSGTQTQSAVNNDVPATIGLSIGKIELVDGEADAVALNPGDYWAAMTTRHSTLFDNSGSGMAPAQQEAFTWGLAAIRTRSMDTLEALVGAFRLGATLFQREGVNVTVGDQHSDYFITNKVAIKAEERVGLAVHRPDFFVETTLDITA